MREFKKLDFPRLREYYTKYPQGYTIYESLLDILEHINEMTDVVNLTLTQWEQIETWILNELKNYSIDQLQTWLDDGTLEEVISDALFESKLDTSVFEDYQTLTNQSLDSLNNIIDDNGVNLRSLGFKLDGSDETEALQQALNTYTNILIPAGSTIGVSDTIVINNRCSLKGTVNNYRVGSNATIKWVGAIEPYKTIIQLGANALAEEPITEGIAITLENITLDGVNKVGFGVYGTFVSHESLVSKVYVTGTTEYAFYLARSWYAHFDELLALENQGNGIALGMPLLYSNGTTVTWTTDYPLEINGTVIRNLRTNRNGLRFVNNPGTYNLDTNIKQGYGLGFGSGSGLVVEGLVSEANGGVGLYVLHDDGYYNKVIRDVYLELNTRYSNLDAATVKPTIILEQTTAFGSVLLENVYSHVEDGGVYHKGVVGTVFKISNMAYGRFLKSLNGLKEAQLRSSVILNDVYYELGTYNIVPGDMIPILTEIVDTRYDFQVINEQVGNNVSLHIYIKRIDPILYGSLYMYREDGSLFHSRPIPDSEVGVWTHVYSGTNASIRSIMKGGSDTGTNSAEMAVRIYLSPRVSKI